MTVEQISSVAIHNLAVATDFGGCSAHAVEHAIAIGRHFGATVHLLHCIQPSKFAFVPEMMPAIDEAAGRDTERYLAELTNTHRSEGVQLQCWVEQGEISEVVTGFVRDHQIDLMVVGTHGRTGIPRLLLGSVAQQIFHNVRCAVLVVGPRAPGAGAQLRLKKILFATDLSQDSVAAVPWVLTAVAEWHTGLDILHVCNSGNPAHPALMTELKARVDGALAGRGHGELCFDLLRGKPTPCVMNYAASHHEDAIVLGLKPHYGYTGPSWSHAYEIMRHAPCPVLSVRN